MKNWLLGVMIVILITGVCFADISADQVKNKVSVWVDGKALSTYDTVTKQDTPPFVTSGRTLMPLRKTFEIFGAEPIWDGTAKTITVETANLSLMLTIGSTEAEVSGRKVTLDVAPVIIGGRTYVPLRFVSETFGIEPTWDGALKRVGIQTQEAFVKELNLHITLSGQQIAAVQPGDRGAWIIHTKAIDTIVTIIPTQTPAETAIAQAIADWGQTTDPAMMYQSKDAVAYSVKLLDVSTRTPFYMMMIDRGTQHFALMIKTDDPALLSTLFNALH